MELPLPIAHYLCALIVKSRSLAYLLVSKDGVLIDAGGALSAYGLEGAPTGERLGKELFFLEGLLPLEGEPVWLSRVKTESGLSADLHIFTDEERDWILLLDATLEEAREILQQQSANELALLRRKLAKLSDR
ncbi:MAG TPA: hypothetical protein DCZ69_19660 [Syntrophobacteraceae bacterium]|nr:hypothetical protein [Syntrophobacteraceae bacterium]